VYDDDDDSSAVLDSVQRAVSQRRMQVVRCVAQIATAMGQQVKEEAKALIWWSYFAFQLTVGAAWRGASRALRGR
jgi:hypothetical protein